MSRLNKAEEIIELAIMFQNSYCGLCIDDIQEHFECSRRSAERMKALLFDLFPEKIELVPTSDKKKRWRFIKGTMNSLISFTSNILDILYTLKTDDEYLKRYKKIIEKIYEPQTICILALKEILGFSDNAIIVDNVRGDINGYAVEIHLGGKYGSFLEVAHENPIHKNEKIAIYLTVKKENKTQSDDELFEILLKENLDNDKDENKYYKYVTENICHIKDYSPELIKEKFENSKIVKLLKQKNVFSAPDDDMVV